MDFFTINQANGILAINTDALHADLVVVPCNSVLIGFNTTATLQPVSILVPDVPLPPPQK